MKLDVSLLKFLDKNDFRTLSSVELGMRNHELVPIELIQKISNMNYSSVKKSISTVHKYKLVFHDSKKQEGYRLTFAGYDYLAVNTLRKRQSVVSIGSRIGVGKESDVFQALDGQNKLVALKLHRLGRVSFKSVKANRDYLQRRTHCNWLYVSRLAAEKEFNFMKILHENDFPIPAPIDQNRHCIVMEYFDGIPLNRVKSIIHADIYYKALISLVEKLAKNGLIHCDFNEFNIMIQTEISPENAAEISQSFSKENFVFDREFFCKLGIRLIDFPQMISIFHQNALEYYQRDIVCLKAFFGNFGVKDDKNYDFQSILAENGQKIDEISENEDFFLLKALKRDRKFVEEKLEKAEKSKAEKMGQEEIRKIVQKDFQKKNRKGKNIKSGSKKERAKFRNESNFLLN